MPSRFWSPYTSDGQLRDITVQKTHKCLPYNKYCDLRTKRWTHERNFFYFYLLDRESRRVSTNTINFKRSHMRISSAYVRKYALKKQPIAHMRMHYLHSRKITVFHAIRLGSVSALEKEKSYGIFLTPFFSKRSGLYNLHCPSL